MTSYPEPHIGMEPGTREEMERAIQEVHSSCFGWALACCHGRREEAEDVLQTSYLKVLDGKAAYNGSSNVRTFLFGVIRHTASERRRYDLVRFLGRSRLENGNGASPPDPESIASDREAHARLRDLLERLSRRQRDLLHLVYYQEMTIEEASEVLGISLGSARTHYERGKSRLRALLNGATPS
jgi:RNA polymerase sigma-70 factor (ECF subfamily)